MLTGVEEDVAKAVASERARNVLQVSLLSFDRTEDGD
jgi:hypothetical protein